MVVVFIIKSYSKDLTIGLNIDLLLNLYLVTVLYAKHNIIVLINK